MSYHLTQTDVQLLHPQNYHYMNGGYYEVHDLQVSMYLTDHQIDIPIYIEQKNINILYNYFV